MSSGLVDLTFSDDDDDEAVEVVDNNDGFASEEEIEPIGVDISVDIVDMAEFDYSDDTDENNDGNNDAEEMTVGEPYQQKLNSEIEDDGNDGDKKMAAKRTTEEKSAALAEARKGENITDKLRNRKRKKGRDAADDEEANNRNNDITNSTKGGKKKPRHGDRRGRRREKRLRRKQTKQREQDHHHHQQQQQQQQQHQQSSRGDNPTSPSSSSQQPPAAGFKRLRKFTKKKIQKTNASNSSSQTFCFDDSVDAPTCNPQSSIAASSVSSKSHLEDRVGVDISVDVVDLLNEGDDDRDNHVSPQARAPPQNEATVGKEPAAMNEAKLVTESSKAKKHYNSSIQGRQNQINPDGEGKTKSMQLADTSTTGRSARKVQAQNLKREQSDSKGVNLYGVDDASVLAETMEAGLSTQPLNPSPATKPPPKAATMAHSVTKPMTVTGDGNSFNPPASFRTKASATPPRKKIHVQADKGVEVVDLLDSDSDEEDIAAAKAARKSEHSTTSNSLDKSAERQCSAKQNRPLNLPKQSTGPTGFRDNSASLNASSLSTSASGKPKAENPVKKQGNAASIKNEGLNSSAPQPEPQKPPIKSERIDEPNSPCRNFIFIDDSSDDESDIECYVPAAKPSARRKPIFGGNGGNSGDSARTVPKKRSYAKPMMKKAAPNSVFRQPEVEPPFREGRDYDYMHSVEAAAAMQDRLFQETINRLRSRGDSHSTSNGANGVARNRTNPANSCHGAQVITAPLLDIPQRYPDHWQWRDPYARLGLPNQAPTSLVKFHYRKLALLYHPDKLNFDDSSARFLAITAAYRKLTS